MYVHLSSYITIDGLKTYNGAGNLGTGVSVRTSPHVTVRNVVTGNHAALGIFTSFSDYILVENNDVFGSPSQSDALIYISNTTHHSIVRGNLIHDNGTLALHYNGDQYASPEEDGSGNIYYTG